MDKATKKLMNKRYPNIYFEHYIAMFQFELSEEGYREHAHTYIDIEGFSSFEELVEEIIMIDKNNDWNYFVKLAKSYDNEGLDFKSIKKLVETTIEVFKVYKKVE